MHFDKLLPRALAVLSLVLTAEARVFEGELIPRSGKANTAPSDKWSSGSLKRADPPSRGRDVGLEDYFNHTDLQWSARLNIGTPGQKVTVAISTTFMPLLVPATNCTTCITRWSFGAANSTTFIPGDGNATRYEFSTGPDTMPLAKPAGARCRLDNDTVGFGDDLKVDSQAFVLCDDYDPLLNNMPIAGLLGLDTYDPSVPHRTLLWNLWESGQLDNPIFALYMPAGVLESGTLTLGGLDATKYNGTVHYLRLHMDVSGNTGGNWLVALNGAYANGRALGNATGAAGAPFAGYALFDTGTAFIQTPDRATAAQLYAQLSPRFELIDAAGAWGAPCAAMAGLAPTLTFSLGAGPDARNFSLPAQNFNLGEYPARKGYCQGVFNSPLAPVRGPGGQPVWVLGSPFLKAYYSVWNGLSKQIGFADLVLPAASEPSMASVPP